MPEPDLALLFLRPLNQLQIRYMVGGSVAAILYGEPRLTHDVDLVVFLRTEQIPLLAAAFQSPNFYSPPEDIIRTEVLRESRGHFNIIHAETGFKADFYTTGRDDLHAWAFRRVRTVAFAGEPIPVAPPEYVIVRKLEYFREGRSEKHLRDIRSIISFSPDLAKSEELMTLLASKNLEQAWQQVLASA